MSGGGERGLNVLEGNHLIGFFVFSKKEREKFREERYFFISAVEVLLSLSCGVALSISVKCF
jgi:hypothetical protein